MAASVNKKLSKIKYCSKNHLLWYQKVYFSNLEVNRWLHLSTSLWGNPLCCDLLSKRIDQKNFFFMATINVNCVSCLMDGTILFCSEFSDIRERSRRGKKTNNKAIAKVYALQANAKSWRTFATKANITLIFFHYENTRLCLVYSLLCFTLQLFSLPGD